MGVQKQEAKRAQSEPRIDADPYRLLFDYTRDTVLCVRAEDGCIVEANPAACLAYGYSREELTRLRVWDLRAPETRSSVAAELTEAADRGLLFETVHRKRDGTQFPVEVNAQGATIAGVRLLISVIRDITERRKIEAAARESEERLRLFVLHAPAAIAMFDREMRYMAFSRRWLADYRLGEQDLTGRSHYDVFPEISEKWREIHRRCLAGAVERCDEDRFARADGTEEWLRWEVMPWKDAEGRIGGIIIFSESITDRKRTEGALRESEEQFRTLANAIPQLCWMANADGWITWYNQRWYEYTGTTPEQMAGWGWQSVHDPEMLPRVMEEWKHSLETGTLFDTVFPFRGDDGVFRPFLSRSLPLRDHEGKVVRWFGTNTDISEQRKAEEALRESEARERARAAELSQAMQRLNAHMDNSPLAVIEFDREFRLTRWSKEAERIFGWSADEVLGRGMTEIPWIYKEDLDSVGRVSRSMIYGSQPRNLSINRNYRKDGSVVECEWYNSAIYDSEGNLASIFSQVLDVTDKKRTEERLRQSQKMESIGLLAGGIAHDFNNLLTGIIGNASLVLDDVEPEAAERISEVIASAERAANLTRQLLAYSGKGQFVVRDIDISEAVNEIASMVEFSIPKSVQLAVNVQRRLPVIRMDPGQLQQILMNLVINAGEAIGEGNTGQITVATSMKDLEKLLVDAIGEELSPGRYVCIEVRDTGSGIEAGDRAKIFDPFFTTKFTGRGLGLAAVAGIIRSLKGGITVQSEPGRGSSFCVYFPAAEIYSRTPEEQSADQERATLMVVDDEATVRDFLSAALSRQGFRVLQASDGREALALCQREQGQIDAAILDVVMPVMGANELLPAFKAARPNMRILLTSGYSEAEARRLCAAYPGAAFIQKPYTARQIVNLVEDLLGKPR